jgi:hypothetical protein
MMKTFCAATCNTGIRTCFAVRDGRCTRRELTAHARGRTVGDTQEAHCLYALQPV